MHFFLHFHGFVSLLRNFLLKVLLFAPASRTDPFGKRKSITRTIFGAITDNWRWRAEKKSLSLIALAIVLGRIFQFPVCSLFYDQFMHEYEVLCVLIYSKFCKKNANCKFIHQSWVEWKNRQSKYLHIIVSGVLVMRKRILDYNLQHKLHLWVLKLIYRVCLV